MSGFSVLYRQTVTLFNRIKPTSTGDVIWYPTVLRGVHLIVDKSSSWNTYGGQETDGVQLHVMYTKSGGNVMIAGKRWYEPKEWRRLLRPEEAITFAHGNNDDFDFFIEGVFDEYSGAISDQNFGRTGFYNRMKADYDNVFAIRSVKKCDLIPHFEITAG